jgi:hypothetical protein
MGQGRGEGYVNVKVGGERGRRGRSGDFGGRNYDFDRAREPERHPPRRDSPPDRPIGGGRRGRPYSTAGNCELSMGSSSSRPVVYPSPLEMVLLVEQEKEQKGKDQENLDDFMFPKYPTGPVTGYCHIRVALSCV